MHGGDVYSDENPNGRDLIDFSSNANPYGPPKSIYKIQGEALEHAMKYPDIEYRLLRKEILTHHNLSDVSVVLGNGAGEIIDLAIRGNESILILSPSYSEYEESAKRYGVEVSHLEYMHFQIEEKKYQLKIDVDDFYRKFESVDAVIIAHPNNPDGSMLDFKTMNSIVEFAKKNNKRIIVDETFFDYSIGKLPFTPFLEEDIDLVIIKAITKFYGLPGIRFGYGLCSREETAKNIRSYQRPWNVNAYAEKFAIECFKDIDYKMDANITNREERSWLVSHLLELNIIERVYMSQGNYILFKLKDVKASEFREELIEEGILVRNCDNYKGLDEYFVRIAVKKRSENIKLLAALKNKYFKGV